MKRKELVCFENSKNLLTEMEMLHVLGGEDDGGTENSGCLSNDECSGNSMCSNNTSCSNNSWCIGNDTCNVLMPPSQ